MNDALEIKNHVIFRNYSNNKYWEISGPTYTTYMPYSIVNEENMDMIMLMVLFHGISDVMSTCKILIEYTNNPHEDMFLVEI